jgi:squalene-hopene/tetraprenyl-beta-curcumene cyclase
LRPIEEAAGRRAVLAGLKWMLALQNRDGGVPTFCRGWGRLPFDRSCPDITAHAVRAILLWLDEFPRLPVQAHRFATKAITYLRTSQREDGSWLPLWFGNQEVADGGNPTYGTAQVLMSLASVAGACPAPVDDMLGRAADYLRASQRADGGWGGAPGCRPSTEETGMAVRALVVYAGKGDPAVVAGRKRLRAMMAENCLAHPRPIGLYFAHLWYSEALYPLIQLAGAGT